MADADWLYWTDAEYGPVSVDELAGLIRSGVVTRKTDVRRQTSVAWSNAAEVLPQLFTAPDGATSATSSPARTGWSDLNPHPWRRYFARMVDNTVLGAITGAVLGIVGYSIAPDATHRFFAVFKPPFGQYLDAILTALLVIPGNALMIGLTGVSLGKWIFGIRVLKDGRPLGVWGALRRELAVWWFGLGAGVFLVSFLTMITCFNRLSHKGATKWDKEQRITIVQRDNGILANLMMWIVGAAVLAAAVATRVPALLNHGHV